jgi:hypothetical protein
MSMTATTFPVSGDAPTALVGRFDEGEGVAYLTLTGEIDIAVAADLERLLCDLARDPEGRLEMNLDAVTFIDVAGLRALSNAHETTGGRITMDRPPHCSLTLLALLEISDCFSLGAVPTGLQA